MAESLSEIASRYNTDKSVHYHYTQNYERFLDPLRDSEVRLLELGIKDGGSLLMWRDYFRAGMIFGLDIEPSRLTDGGLRIKTYQGRQEDKALLDSIAADAAPQGFDVIIDDCAHIGVLARESFRHLFYEHLKSGGWYVIEDWGTGYWDSWVDGSSYRLQPKSFSRILYRMTRAAHRLAVAGIPLVSTLAAGVKRSLGLRQINRHDHGMVGFVKELIDEVGLPDRTHPHNGKGASQRSCIAEMHIFQSHAFLKKA
ncbi:MAG TPA: hypothetical protein VGI80_07865 [Pyrinomonadaceae bacterium]|jgi:hypothetical protein